MAKCKGFRNFKERGEWVEVLFMACALRKLFRVSKPWGDSGTYDVGIELRGRLLRVQVKSTSCRLSNGYQCSCRPNQKSRPYTRRMVDFFAAYIVPEDVWYIIPASVVFKTKSSDLMLCPVQKRVRRDGYKYESYREAWKLLRSGKKTRVARRSRRASSAKRS
jgi:hypothetical protein